ncbi:MAG: hypothetical protein AABY15_01480 [Nanoarchaeota archaeon]
MEALQKEKRIVGSLFLTVLLLVPFVNAHGGLYHNYAGSGTGFLMLLAMLFMALVIYEKLGDTPLGYSILWIGILIPLYIDLFFPQNDEITKGMLVGSLIIIVVAFWYNYKRKILR